MRHLQSKPRAALPRPPLGPGPGALECLEERILLSLNPTAYEQEMLEWVNRMRMFPAEHWDDMFTGTNPLLATDPDIQSAVNFFHVDGPTLQAQWSALSAVPPLAWHEALVTAARTHSQLMIDWGTQSHQLPGEDTLSVRVTDAGYVWQYSVQWGENVYAFGDSVLQAHAGFAVDWGTNPPSGIQDPPGHRNNLMSTDFREIGVGILTDAVPGGVGPYVITEDFGVRGDLGDPYLLGTVWDDTNSNGLYNAGEQLGGVTVRVLDALDQQVALLTTMTAGGYQTQLPAGTYTVQFYGGALSGTVEKSVTIGAANVKVDAIAQEAVLPMRLTGPAFGATVVSGQGSVVPWAGGQAGTTVDLWRLGPAGWNLEAAALPAANAQYTWDTTGAPLGRHTFAARIQNGAPGQAEVIFAPDWVLVTALASAPAPPAGLTIAWTDPTASAVAPRVGAIAEQGAPGPKAQADRDATREAPLPAPARLPQALGAGASLVETEVTEAADVRNSSPDSPPPAPAWPDELAADWAPLPSAEGALGL